MAHFGVGWLPIGTFNLQVIIAVEERVFRPGSSRHPNQVPYIVTWKNLMENLLPPPLDKSHSFPKTYLTGSGHQEEGNVKGEIRT